MARAPYYQRYPKIKRYVMGAHTFCYSSLCSYDNCLMMVSETSRIERRRSIEVF